MIAISLMYIIPHIYPLHVSIGLIENSPAGLPLLCNTQLFALIYGGYIVANTVLVRVVKNLVYTS